ncbi:MAG TPA: hypothetical protein VHL30_01400 [Chlamydiales bacterium]|jgi:hypothetical protein|nr:hypothetical protein [Chlamydiales bacterium]
MNKIYRINEDGRIQNSSVAQPIAYDALSPKPIQELGSLSTIASSNAEREIPPLRPQLPLPDPEYLHFDPELQADVQALVRDYQALQKSAMTALETVEDLEQKVEAATASDLTEEQRVHFLRLVLDLHNTFEEISKKHLDFIGKQIRLDSAELEKLNLKKTEEMKKYAELVKDEDTWSFFGTIAEYFLYALSLVLGGTLMATGAGLVASSFLIAAGGIGMANRVMHDTGAWQNVVAYFIKSREMQDKIAHWISSSLFFVSMGLGLIGGAATWQCGGLRLIDAAMGTEKTIEKLTVAATLANAGIKVREFWAGKETKTTEAALKLIEGKLTLMRQTLQETASEAKKTIETMQLLTKQAKEAISAFG